MFAKSVRLRARVALLGILLLSAALLASGCGARGGAQKSGKSSGSWVSELSADQKRVAEEFGPPSAFGLAFGTDVMGAVKDPGKDAGRLEWWDYPELHTRFVFSDGAFASSDSIPDPADEAASEIYYVAATPDDFSEGMSLDAVKELLGGAPTKEVTFKPEMMAGLTAYDWNGVVTAVFDKEGLVGIETGAATEGGAQ